MQLLGIKRVKKVYAVWFFVYLILVASILFLELKTPNIVLGLVIIFLMKDILLDFNLVKLKRARVYWAEHAPLSLLIFFVGVLGLTGINFFEGYVGLLTTFLAGIEFLLNLSKDLMEDPTVYFKKVGAKEY